MATLYPSPPILRVRRSAQSGNKTMTAAWASVYASSSLYTYLFSQGIIDLTNMVAGDIIDVRVRKQVDPAGALILHDQKQFFGVQPNERKQFKIGAIFDVYGLSIDMRQTAGALRTLYCEFVDARR